MVRVLHLRVSLKCIFLPQCLWHNPNGVMAVQTVDRLALRSRIYVEHFICTINTEFSQNFHSQLTHGARRQLYTPNFIGAILLLNSELTAA